ncbi:MAG: hypothetical protein ABI540_10170 [Spartobacteria bacterium]
MKKIFSAPFAAGAAALLAFASPVSAGILTLDDGSPTFNPQDSFSNNTIVANTIIVGGLINLEGNVTVAPDASEVATIEVSGTFSATAGEIFSIAYNFAADLNTEAPVAYTLTGTASGVAIPPIAGTITPGLHVYQGTAAMPFPFPTDVAGTFSGTLELDFNATNGPAVAAPGTLDLMVQQIDFQLDVLPAGVTPPAQSQNISTRANVGTGDRVLIGGIIITGSDTEKVVLRAIGPSSGVAGALADPVLDLYDSSGALIASNDNWMENSAEDQTFLTDNMLEPGDDAESAIVADLEPGAYTAIVSGANDTTGIALVEAYDINDGTTASKFANISTRGFVEADPDVMIGGFILGGGGGFSQVIVRGLGPSLAAFGVTDALSDPMLDLRDADGNLVASNDNWMDDPNMDQVVAHNLAPTDTNEAALYQVLPIGAYTAVLSGVGGATGIALVESYDVNTTLVGNR